jgi:predicted acylesterase/phospholipase RssA
MTDTVSVKEEQEVEQVATPEVEQQNDVSMPVEEQRDQQVPLSALQKERRKRQEMEQELRMFREHQLKMMQQPATQEEDESQYEPVTKADLKQQEAKFKQLQAQTMRDAEEKTWIRQNPEKAEFINDRLTDFLKKRPNLAAAIEGATNRYEEAWELMDKLTPRQKAALTAPPAVKKATPGSPSGIPKAAAMNQAVDVMTMTDSEFASWRASQRKRR